MWRSRKFIVIGPSGLEQQFKDEATALRVARMLADSGATILIDYPTGKVYSLSRNLSPGRTV